MIPQQLLTGMIIGIAFALLIACGNKKPTQPTIEYSYIAGKIFDSSDSGAISNANVVVYDAETNAPVTRDLTDENGYYNFEVEIGAYYLKIAAQGYIPSPPKGGAPIPFQVDANRDTLFKDLYLTIDPAAANTGSISGMVQNTSSIGMTGFLIVSTNTAGTQIVSGSSGPDGYYVLYNLEPGLYTIKCLHAGYKQSTPLQVTVTADMAVTDADITAENTRGASLSGQITFLASPNSTVDITLIDIESREAIPGLSTYNNNNNAYSLDSVPPGTFLTWATYQNDGYVMDPDWIRKSGLPTLTVTETTGSVTKDFSVTDAIPLISPTNSSDSIYARAISTTAPTFNWGEYPQSKEYILEVRDKNGKRIWGGFDATTILHQQIPKENRSVVFDFDGSATEQLQPGEIYQWKVYADADAAPNIQGLISSSEDLMGLFKIVIDTAGSL